MPEPEQTLRAAFEEACNAVAARRAEREPVIRDLLARLAEPHRRYHDAVHVAACLTVAHAHRDHASRPAEVALALLFHDAVYSRGPGDERASAELATGALESLGVAPEVRERVARLVLATADHDPAGDPDAELVLDADLSILGGSDEDYDAFEHAIRQEFDFVPAEVFRRGRADVLRRFLERPVIFRVPGIQSAREGRARHNLTRSLARLAAE